MNIFRFKPTTQDFTCARNLNNLAYPCSADESRAQRVGCPRRQRSWFWHLPVSVSRDRESSQHRGFARVPPGYVSPNQARSNRAWIRAGGTSTLPHKSSLHPSLKIWLWFPCQEGSGGKPAAIRIKSQDIQHYCCKNTTRQSQRSQRIADHPAHFESSSY